MTNKKASSKESTPALRNGDVVSSIAFAKWIGEQMNKDSWFEYDARFGKWYWHTKGHLTTEELYEVWLKQSSNTCTN